MKLNRGVCYEAGPTLYGGGLYGGHLLTLDSTEDFFSKCRLYGGTLENADSTADV